ncbi:MAG: DUF1499 domain-containing protein [Verrucomicrobiae bacterium]|nr:DUF1499 domain-containing protein [Verrucomicrobiae bacterium]
MNILTTIASAMALLVAVVAVAFLALGADRFWRFFGEPDLGPVVFETLQRRTSPNDALACPPGFCKALIDLATPVYRLPARDLRIALAKAMADEPRATKVDSNDATLTDRYIVRSALMGYPDTVVVRFMDQPDGRSTMALYSRSKFGHSDLGANKARIARLLAKVSSHVPHNSL